ncbi:MAG: hypothetical protein CSA81_10495 [Acidobacteria bacterium]|nr:MAG: hypothetical protein CSA81_10495 [Acidobacteriota bacterium]
MKNRYLVKGVVLFLILSLMPTQAVENVIRFKLLKAERESSTHRFQGITEIHFGLEDVASIEYEEEDTGYAVTDEMWLNTYFGFFVTAAYYGQYSTTIQLNDGSLFTVDENIIMLYGGVSFKRDFKKRVRLQANLGYGYWRDRMRANNLASANLDPPEDTLYKISNHEGFSPAFEVSLSYFITPTVALTANVEHTDVFDLDMEAWSASLSIIY